MDTTASVQPPAEDNGTLDDEWITHHFDHFSPTFSREMYSTLARARSLCPVAHSDQHDGFWVASRYADILAIAQDWQTFSSELGMTVPTLGPPMKILPVNIDPPLQRTFKRLINRYFTPAAVTEWESATRTLVNRLLDDFIEAGSCEFMDAFARPLPGLAFFDLALHAPPEQLTEVNHYATLAAMPHHPDSQDCLFKLGAWIAEFIAERRRTGPRGDVVDGVLGADIEGRPITDEEAIGTIMLLVLGGLETTSGVLGMAMHRFCLQPEIPERLRRQPELIPAAVEELVRLDGSFVCIGRTAREDTQVAGRDIKAGERILLYWSSANRDEAEFDNPDAFDLDRTRNRHLAFGAGTHRCAGSNLARMNLRVAVEELVGRLHDVRLQTGAEVDFHTTFNRSPISVPITFAPGPKTTAA